MLEQRTSSVGDSASSHIDFVSITQGTSSRGVPELPPGSQGAWDPAIDREPPGSLIGGRARRVAL